MAEKETKKNEEVKEYSSMKRDELLVLAKSMGAKVNTKTKKADLIAAIEAIEKEGKTAEPEVTEVAETEIVEEAKPEKEAEAETDEEPEAEEKAEEAVEETAAEAVEEAAEKEEPAKEEPEKTLSSTERKRKMKAERREAKAARKEANVKEEKKKRPSNLLLAILIFGVLIGMFAFIKGYNYFTKPASIEKYMDEQGMTEMYTDIPYDEHSTITVRAKDNTIRMLIKLDEDITDEDLKEYTGDDATEDLKEMGAGFLTSMKPQARGFGGTVKVGVKKGDETVNYVKLSYSEAKKIMKDLEKKAEEEADDAEDAAEDAADDAEDEAEEADED